MSARGTRAATVARVNIVYSLLLVGLDRQHILSHIATKYPLWRCRPSTVDTYIAKAKVLVEQAGEYKRPLEFGRSLARKHDLYAHFMLDKDYRGALSAQDKIDELLGLKAPVKIDIASERERLVDLMCQDVMREANRATSESAG